VAVVQKPKGRVMTPKTVIFITAFAVASLVPQATQVVFGAANTTARVNDTIKVGVFVDQNDTGLREVTVSVPYAPGTLEYMGLEGEGLTANNIVVDNQLGSVNVKWTGTLPAGTEQHLGYVLFRVRKADKSLFQGNGVNPSAKDADGSLISDIDVLPSEAIVQLSPRPLRLQLDLLVE
jgi:hypothetical protein